MAEHVARFFSEIGIDTTYTVGLDGAVASVHAQVPDVVVCEYDLLATLSLDVWERDDILCRTPVLAVSLTRRPNEMHLLDVNNIAGFLYLPLLRADDAHRILHGAAMHHMHLRDANPLFSNPSDTLGAQ